jgi:hypothetical protein
MMKKTTLISLAGLALLPLSNVSYAEDQKTYAGSQCEAYYADEAARVRKTNSSIFAGGQPGGQGVAVRCPIVRDNVSNWDGTQAAYVFVAKGGPGGWV